MPPPDLLDRVQQLGRQTLTLQNHLDLTRQFCIHAQIDPIHINTLQECIDNAQEIARDLRQIANRLPVSQSAAALLKAILTHVS